LTPPSSSAPATTRLSVIVPVYNEEVQLRAALENLVHSSCPIEREWIVVDDASSDGSAAILDEMAPEYGLRVIHLERNQGKGAAVIRGFAEATGDYVMIHDADFEYDPRDIPALLEPLENGEADVVYGSRFRKEATQVHRTYHYMVNRFLTALSNFMSGIYLTDMETCYKVFRSDLLHAMRLRSRRFGIEVELTAYVAKTRARVYERPIRYYPRTQLQGKKINWKDGVAALFHLVRFNWMTGREAAFRALPARYAESPAPGAEARVVEAKETPCPPPP
jgi:glycosyltransferase involved in cell wall biosynthesis